MTAHQNAGTPPDARADRAPLHRGRRRPAVRWIAHGVLFVAQAVSLGCYAQLYRRVLRPGADGKRKARDGAAWLTALQALFSSDQEVFPVRRNILRTAARPPIQR